MFEIPSAPTRVHYFIEEHSTALQHAALLIGGRSWLRRVQWLIDSLHSQGSLQGKTGDEIEALYGLLTSVNDRPIRGSVAAYANYIEPMSTHIENIMLLADDLWHVLQRETAAPSGQVKGESGDTYA